MLAGMQDPGDSMFSRLMPTMEPSAKELEENAQAAMFNKTVKLSEVTSGSYDLSKTKENEDYEKLIKELFRGTQAKTHIILYHDRQFVTCADKPRWIAHVEWAEFELNVKANPTTDGSPK